MVGGKSWWRCERCNSNCRTSGYPTVCPNCGQWGSFYLFPPAPIDGDQLTLWRFGTLETDVIDPDRRDAPSLQRERLRMLAASIDAPGPQALRDPQRRVPLEGAIPRAR